MKTERKLELLREYYPDYEIEAIETDRFNGIWFRLDNFEHVVLSNEEDCYASNNIVEGDMSDNFEHSEEFPELMVYSND